MTFHDHDLARSTVTAVRKKYACGGARTENTTCARRDEIESEVAVVRGFPDYQPVRREADASASRIDGVI